jgi:hypothetical protein
MTEETFAQLTSISHQLQTRSYELSQAGKGSSWRGHRYVPALDGRHDRSLTRPERGRGWRRSMRDVTGNQRLQAGTVRNPTGRGDRDPSFRNP